MMRKIKIICATAALIISFGGYCWPMGLHPFHSVQTEFVMEEGAEITASNSFGNIRIKAGKGTERTYFWDDKKETVRLRKRPSRWFGNLGVYHPGGGRRFHLVVEEGEEHFSSLQEALEWFLPNDRLWDWVCTSDGLIVGWSTEEMPKKGYWAVIVDVYQIYIDGKKPDCSSFPFANTIQVEGARPPERTDSSFIPSKPKKINGRLYSGRVVDLMMERNITAIEIEEAIAHGGIKKIKGRWIAVTTDASGRVVRVN